MPTTTKDITELAFGLAVLTCLLFIILIVFGVYKYPTVATAVVGIAFGLSLLSCIGVEYKLKKRSEDIHYD